QATGSYDTVGGGGGNIAGGAFASVGGGQSNAASGSDATVCGGLTNTASGNYATVPGGNHSIASGQSATIGGGEGNLAGGAVSTVGGGSYSSASGNYSTVGGGLNNTASGTVSTVGGGQNNTAIGGATVGGGYGNQASGTYDTVAGGYGNTTGGSWATVPGGVSNTAQGNYSFAAGNRAKANNQGCFVWADSTNADYTCSTSDRFQVRANGGARFDVNGPSFVQILNAGGDLITTSTGAHLTTGGAWTNNSDAAAKENFSPVDGKEVLASVAAMPISTWSYRVEGSDTVHMGPTAQDFYSAFKLGGSDTSITTIDADGVALASIQGLYELSQEQATRIQALEDENASLKQGLDSLDARVTALEGANGTSNSSNGGSAGLFSSSLSIGWLPIGGLLVAGLVLVQRRRTGGKR
ncbi:MAG: tail fiber domain-containing protein, partial [Dehalococcoidia bacterium]